MHGLQCVDVLRAHLQLGQLLAVAVPAAFQAFILKVMKPGSTAATAASLSSCTPKPGHPKGERATIARQNSCYLLLNRACAEKLKISHPRPDWNVHHGWRRNLAKETPEWSNRH